MSASRTTLAAWFAAALTVAGCSSGLTDSAGPATTTGAGPASTATTAPPTTVATTVPPTSLPVSTEPPPTIPPRTEAPPPPPPPGSTATTFVPGSSAQVISRGDPDRAMVALTFDAGADAGYAGDILDTLAAEGIRASFGLTGRWAEANPDLVVRMAAEGHQLINHTWDHSSFTGVSARPAIVDRAARIDQLDRTEAVIVSLTGRSTKPWFRPPYGDDNASVNADVAAVGYTYNIRWTVDSLGWQGLSADAIADRCVNRTVAGAILLFHVGGRSQDAAALPAIVARLRLEGYSFGTVAQVIGL